MFTRAVILPEEKTKSLNINLEPIDLSYLKIISTAVDFSLSFIKDRKVNSIFMQYLRPFIVAVTERYEYKPTDYIISVSPARLSLAKPQTKTAKKISKNDILRMLEIISEWIKENSNSSDGKEVLEKLREIALSHQQLQLDR